MPLGSQVDHLLTEDEAADFLRLSPLTLKDWRKSTRRCGVPFVKIEWRAVRYRLSDVEAYLKRRTVRPRSE